MKAWVYLALFGADDDADDSDAEETDPNSLEGRNGPGEKNTTEN